MSDDEKFAAIIVSLLLLISVIVGLNVANDTPNDCQEACGQFGVKKFSPDGTCECKEACR